MALEQRYQCTWNNTENPADQEVRAADLTRRLSTVDWGQLATFEEIIAAGRELELMALTTPRELGGQGLGTRQLAGFFRAFERLDTAASHSIGYQNSLSVLPLLFAGRLERGGPLEQVARGQALGTFVMTEPQGGSNMRGMNQMATETAHGWRISGVKRYIAHAEVADYFILNARTSGGFKAFVVDARQPGIQVTQRFELAYMRRIYVNEVVFDSLEVQNEQVLHDEKVIYDTMMITRLFILAGKIGHLERCLDHLRPFIETRRISTGLMKDNASVKRRVANLEIGIRVLSGLLEYSLRCEESGGTAYDLTMAAKIAGIDLAFEASHTLQFSFGARGLDHGTGIPLVCDDVRTWALMEGASEPLAQFLALNYLTGRPWIRSVAARHPDLFADIPCDPALAGPEHDLPSLGSALAWVLVAVCCREVGALNPEEHWYTSRRIGRYLQDFQGAPREARALVRS